MAVEIDERLRRVYRPYRRRPALDLTRVAVHTILSQNTSRSNYTETYRRLTDRFPTLEELALAPLAKIEEAIRVGGLARQKAEVIKSFLSSLALERGSYSLDFLKGMSTPEARRYLTSFKGIGPKTASCILLFGLGRQVMPVDTHVHRVALRLGLLPSGTDAKKAEKTLEGLIPGPRRYRMHLNLVALGRDLCHPRSPGCDACPLDPVCAWHRAHKLSGK